MKKEKKPFGRKQMILLGILVAMGIGYYFYLSNRPVDQDEPVTQVTATQEALLRNLEMNYPPSPRELVRYYSELTKCFYDKNNTEEQVAQLASKSRELFDEKLVATQTDEEYLEELKAEIARFAEEDINISSYNVSSSVDVKFHSKDGDDWATLYCTYSIRQHTNRDSIRERFVLRKDEDGHWKIYGWEKVNENGEVDSGDE